MLECLNACFTSAADKTSNTFNKTKLSFMRPPRLVQVLLREMRITLAMGFYPTIWIA